MVHFQSPDTERDDALSLDIDRNEEGEPSIRRNKRRVFTDESRADRGGYALRLCGR